MDKRLLRNTNIYLTRITTMVSPNKRSKTSDSSEEANATQNMLLVPLTVKKDTEEVDLHSMTEEDLKLLQKKGKQTCCCCSAHITFLDSDDPLSQTYLPSCETDPFLYYSIPGVREAALSLKEVDYSKISQSACKVSRKTRVSFEKHTDLLLDELFGDELDGLGEPDLCLGELGGILELLYKTQ